MMLHINSIHSQVKGAGSAFERFYGRAPRLTVPGLNPYTWVEQQKLNISRINAQEKVAAKKGRGNTEHFKVGDDVRIRNLKTLKWDLIGIVSKEIPSEDSVVRTYEVELSDGSFHTRNGKYLHHRIKEAQETDIGEDLDTQTVQANGDNVTQKVHTPRLVTDFRNLNPPTAGPVTRLAAAKAKMSAATLHDVCLESARPTITGLEGATN